MLHYYSFSTVLMTILACNILVILVTLIFLNKNIMADTGYKLLAFFAGLAVLRFMFPYEFPFSINVYPPQIISRLLFNLQAPRWLLFDVEISYWIMLELLWAVGIVVRLMLNIGNYWHSRDYILKYGRDCTDDIKYREALEHICSRYGHKNVFRVIELEGLDMPTLFHRKTPCILLPAHISIPSDKLCYILQHEAIHHFRRDFLIKGAVRLLTSIYWWNPVCLILQKQINVLLEMAVDQTISRHGPSVREEYADCLLYMRKQSLASSVQTPVCLKRDSIFLLHSQSSDLKKRYTMLFHTVSSRKRVCATAILTAMFLGVYLLSYQYIIEADYCPPELSETTSTPTPDNTYFIKIEESVYEIYFNGILMETVTSLEFYPKGIKIYNTEGVLIGETKREGIDLSGY